MSITQQDISDRIAAIGTERHQLVEAQQARFQAEVRSLQELCGGHGHVFTHTWSLPSHRRVCAICGVGEPD